MSGGAHQRLADQDGVDADLLELVELLAGRDAGLGDDHLARRHVGEQLEGALEVDAEVAQVAVVDAEQLGVDVERDLELLLVVDLDEHVEVERRAPRGAATSRSSGCSAATISRIASAPAAAAS